MMTNDTAADTDSDVDHSRRCSVWGDQDLVALARSHGMGPEAAQAVAAIDTMMQDIRRSMVRRDFGRQLLSKLETGLDVAHLDVISAIWHAAAPGAPVAEEVTVGFIAERLGIDPSRASRVSAEVVERGYARRVASQSDARRICLELTAKGTRLIEAVRTNKWELLSRALGKWDETDLVTFATLLERFSTWATDPDGLATSAEAIKRLLAEPK